MRKAIAWAAIVLLGMGFSGCAKNSPLGPSVARENGKLSFALAAADNIASGNVTIHKGGITQVQPVAIANHVGSVNFENIQVGTWQIQISLFDQNGAEIYSGSGTAVVLKNQTTVATVQVDQNLGNLAIIVTMPANDVRGKIMYRDNLNGLYTMDLNGANKQLLIKVDNCTTEGSNYRGGSQLVFVSIHPYAGGYDGIFVANLDGSNCLRLDLPALNHPRWSWDGSKLAAVDRNSPCNIVTFNPDGSDLVVLRSGNSPAWTSDNRILYTYDNCIRIMNADGSNDQLIIAGLSEPFVSDCSPSGTILFDAYDSASGTHQQYSIQMNGSGLTQLTSGVDFTCAGRYNDNGTMITFERREGDAREIWLMNADGSNQQQLTFNSQLDEGPVFIFY